MTDLIRALEERGFRKEYQGGGCHCMARYESERTIIVTGEFDSDLPDWDSWYIGIYDCAGEYWTESNLLDNLDSSQSPCGILAALDGILPPPPRKLSFDEAYKGMRRRARAMRPSRDSNLIDCLNRAGARLYGDRAGAPDAAKRYADLKRHRLILCGDCDRLNPDIFA